MGNIWVPRILRPDYTWPTPIRTAISEVTPPVPGTPSPTVLRFWGFVHRLLLRFSKHYCSFFGIPFDSQIAELPFGILLKWTERTRLEEAMAMQMARGAGMPVPKVLCCGVSPSLPNWPISILMTRLPGLPLGNSNDQLLPDDEEGPWIKELEKCLQAMRKWQSPWGETFIGSVSGTSIATSRVPNHKMGPFSSEIEMHDYLLSPASPHGFSSKEKYEETLVLAGEIKNKFHQIVFTHGDFKAHNMLIDENNHLSGFLDWECAGWYPDYWEFTTAMRFGKGSWWYQVASRLGGDKYLAELECDVALNRLTVDSYIAW